MELTELTAELDELRPDDEDVTESVQLLMAKVGQMAEGSMQLGEEAIEVEDEMIDEIRRDLLAGVVFAAIEYAEQHDLDTELAVEERLEQIREKREQQQAIRDAIESGDAAGLADALDADAQEVPTGDDDEDGRMFQ